MLKQVRVDRHCFSDAELLIWSRGVYYYHCLVAVVYIPPDTNLKNAQNYFLGVYVYIDMYLNSCKYCSSYFILFYCLVLYEGLWSWCCTRMNNSPCTYCFFSYQHIYISKLADKSMAMDSNVTLPRSPFTLHLFYILMLFLSHVWESLIPCLSLIPI